MFMRTSKFCMLFSYVTLGLFLQSVRAEEIQDDPPEVYPMHWRVDEKGRLWIGPDPAIAPPDPKSERLVVEELPGTIGSVWPLFDRNRQGFSPEVPDEDAIRRRTMWDSIKEGGIFFPLQFGFNGGLDRASLIDAELYFRKLNLGVDDAALIERIGAPPKADLPPAATSRAELERLLAVRLVGHRNVKSAREALAKLQASPTIDPLTRGAAAMSLAMLEGQPLPRADVSGLPTLYSALQYAPEECDLVMVFRPYRCPVSIFMSQWGGRFARQAMRSVLGTMAPEESARGMAIYCEDLIQGEQARASEIVRLHGNQLSLRHFVAASIKDSQGNWPAFVLVSDGVFKMPQVEGMAEPQQHWEEDGLQVIQSKPAMAPVAFSESRFVQGTMPLLGKRKSLSGLDKSLDVLKKEGVESEQAFWFHLRDARSLAGSLFPPASGQQPFSLSALTGSLDFPDGKGMLVVLAGRFASEEDAGAAKDLLSKQLEQMVKGWTAAPSTGTATRALLQKLQGVTFEVRGVRLEAKLQLPYQGIEQLLMDCWKVRLEQDKALEKQTRKAGANP